MDEIKSAFDLNHNVIENYDYEESFMAGTTTVQAADTSGWMVSITPSGGWIPAVIAGNTGIGLSQECKVLFWMQKTDLIMFWNLEKT